MRNRDDLAPVMRETRNGLSLLFGDRLEDVLLYGSFARGTQDEESDVDIMLFNEELFGLNIWTSCN